MAEQLILSAVRQALGSNGRAVAVGFSGGVDSSVLLGALARLRGELGVRRLRALHVHHGLMEQADGWAAHAARAAAELGVSFEQLDVDARAHRGEGPEAAARRARYAALARALDEHELLCLAHHASDAVETFLIHLLRGSGPRGLGPMPRQRRLGKGELIRPLLDLSREQVMACARAWDLAWVEDESNRDPRLLRARIRHELLPLLRSIRPGVDRVLMRGASLQSEAWQSLAQLASMDRQACEGSCAGTLSRAALQGLGAPRRRELLRSWLNSRSLRPPGYRRLLELDRQLCSAAAQRGVRVAWRDGQVLTHGDDAYALAADALILAPSRANPCRLTWDPSQPLVLAHGTLSACPRPGVGLRYSGAVEVRTGESGVRCRPAGRRHSAPLKELLRRLRIPPWERAGLPLLYAGGTLAAVADVLVCEGFQARAGETGLQLHWLPCWRERSGYRRLSPAEDPARAEA